MALPSSSVRGRRAVWGATRAGLGAALLLLGPALATAQPVQSGVAYLTGSQAPDGSWPSLQVRAVMATTEALRALQVLGVAPDSRLAAVIRLEEDPIEDTDDRARRLLVLAAEGRDVAALIDQLRLDADPSGGWGLAPGFPPDPLDTGLAMAAVAPGTALGDSVLIPALSYLLGAQQADGGWACVDGGESDIYCTAYALLGLAPYRARFFIDPQVTAGATFLKDRRNPTGSFGPSGAGELLNSAAASLALATLPALSSEIGLIQGYLVGQQQSDGSWENDPFMTGLVLQALHALSRVPFCGDGVANQTAEACDGADVRGATCGGLGLGTGVVACTSTCTLDTTGCTGPPRCGDGAINQPGEACDGAALGGETCEGLGLGPGTLACSPSCTFDTTGCAEPPRCGDGVINQAGELCDGADLGGKTCVDIGFLGGTLACQPDCTFDAAACVGTPFCGDGIINGPDEDCDRTDLGGRTCENLGLGGGTLVCASNCKLQTAGCATSGAASPRSIDLGPGAPVCSGGTQTVPVSIAFPAGSVIDKVDVFLLFDDTGSFAGLVPPVTSIFGQLVSQLQTALPQVSFSFGVGRFEDYGGPGTGFSAEFTTGRPFTLNQPMVTPEVPNFTSLINSALSRSAPGFGGDGPESNIEALKQVATGSGFDGNGNGSFLDSGPAGAALTQTSPGTSGDVPPFSSNVAPASGTLGGVGFRPGALHLVLSAGDICPVAPFTAGQPVPLTITGAGGATVATSALRCSNTLGSQRYGFVSNSLSTSGNTVAAAVAPRGSATVPETVAALNSLGISVIGLAPGGVAIRNPVGPSGAPSTSLSALALLTGATDATGLPLVFNISGGVGPIRDAIVQAVTIAATRPRDISLTFSGVPAGLSVSFTPPVVPDVGPGESAAFDVTFTGDGSVIQGTFPLSFVDVASNAQLATIPVTVGCLPTPPVPVDDDGDGYPEDVDCDDTNPDVNPGADEIPGNGIDDDCNEATPDQVPPISAACRLRTDKLNYTATDVAGITSDVSNLTSGLTLSGLSATLTVGPSGDPPVSTQSRSLLPLAPGGHTEDTFTFSAAGRAPGEYLALLTVHSGADTAAMCSVAFTIESSAVTGAGLRGTLVLDPAVVNAGSPSDATYTVTNQGNVDIAGLGIKVLLVDPDSGQQVGQILDTASLAVGATHAATRPFSTVGLATKTYIAVLIAVLPGSGLEQTLASANLTVVNTPPDCAGATPEHDDLWPPNHRFVDVVIGGVTDPDGDPVTTTIVSVFQDEPTDGSGDGSTCPDAQGTGTSTAQVRSERSGNEDGRVYHIRFQSEDGRGASCTGVVTVCVPHDQGHGDDTCVDQGPVFDSAVCLGRQHH
jgi:Putative metal-binding motif/Prenyltransferase and squalene oxidase repeat